MFTGNYGSNRANTATYEGGFEKGHEDIIRAKGRMRIIQCPVLGSKLGTAWFPQQCFPPTPAAPARSSRQVMSARAPLSSRQMGFGAAAAFSLGCCPKQSLLLRHVCFHTLQMMVSDLNPPTWCWNCSHQSCCCSCLHQELESSERQHCYAGFYSCPPLLVWAILTRL